MQVGRWLSLAKGSSIQHRLVGCVVTAGGRFAPVFLAVDCFPSCFSKPAHRSGTGTVSLHVTLPQPPLGHSCRQVQRNHGPSPRQPCVRRLARRSSTHSPLHHVQSCRQFWGPRSRLGPKRHTGFARCHGSHQVWGRQQLDRPPSSLTFRPTGLKPPPTLCILPVPSSRADLLVAGSDWLAAR